MDKSRWPCRRLPPPPSSSKAQFETGSAQDARISFVLSRQNLLHPEHHARVGRQFSGEIFLTRQILAEPQVADLRRGGESQIAPGDFGLDGLIGTVEETDGSGAVFKFFRPGFRAGGGV